MNVTPSSAVLHEIHPDQTQHASPVHAVAAVHAAIDVQTEAFSHSTGITCPPGCGACCHSPHVEAAIADVMPLAEEIVRRGEAAAVLARLNDASDLRCVLFDADADDVMKGRCSMYAWRPSVCRLFGFAGRRDADGQPQFTACRVHTQLMPEVVAAAREAVASGTIALPILSDLAGQASAVASGASATPRPINDALRQAIMHVGLQMQLASLAASTDDSPDSPKRPPSPHRHAA